MMKIQCDVCDKAEASVFCTADEAALCQACDQRVHHANKLASKHQRFSLLRPSANNRFPLCDVCQERRAFLFCQQDRAILCRECDLPIHMANEHTKKHNRFLLTGVKLSSSSAVYTSSASFSVSNTSGPKFQPSNKKSVASGNTLMSFPTMNALTNASSNVSGDVNSRLMTTEGDGSTSSISEYLIDTIPGWHVEELLEFSAPPPFGLCKDTDFETPVNSFSIGSSEIWVPEARHKANPSQFSSQMSFRDTKKASSIIKANQTLINDGFTVPQISPSSTGKRSRTYW